MWLRELLLHNCSAWPCLDPAYIDLQTFISGSVENLRFVEPFNREMKVEAMCPCSFYFIPHNILSE